MSARPRLSTLVCVWFSFPLHLRFEVVCVFLLSTTFEIWNCLCLMLLSTAFDIWIFCVFVSRLKNATEFELLCSLIFTFMLLGQAGAVLLNTIWGKTKLSCMWKQLSTMHWSALIFQCNLCWRFALYSVHDKLCCVCICIKSTTHCSGCISCICRSRSCICICIWSRAAQYSDTALVYCCTVLY